MGTSQGIDSVKNRLYYEFKAYENRSRLNSRLDMIGQDFLKINKYQVILSETETVSIAESYGVIAQHSLKAIILFQVQEQEQEEKQIKEMTMQ